MYSMTASARSWKRYGDRQQSFPIIKSNQGNTKMEDIIRIMIKGESGFGPTEKAYSEKVTMEHDSFRYAYEPMIENKRL